MSTKIAVIYEGVKSEKEIFENINKIFFSKSKEISVFTFPADGNIYMLWERLKTDEFETDVINIVKEMCNTCQNQELRKVKASEFSEIYLFFDFDIHNNNIKKEHKTIDVLFEMFETFNNETEFGKLYVSYPMVESIKDISIEKREYTDLYISVEESANYKKYVSCLNSFANYSKLTREMWIAACDASRKRASLIVTYKEDCEYEQFLSLMTQDKIYEVQKDLFVKRNNCIAVLNSIPLFLLEYFKRDFWEEVTQKA